MTNETYPVLMQWTGQLEYVKIMEIRNENCGRRSGRLSEPFASRMGWFDYDRLLRKGKAESQGFTIYTFDFWNSNGTAEIAKYERLYRMKADRFRFGTELQENAYRERLGLPESGNLRKLDIEKAFKMAAKRVHPDVGGTDYSC
jgi:hypothetical protein